MYVSKCVRGCVESWVLVSISGWLNRSGGGRWRSRRELRGTGDKFTATSSHVMSQAQSHYVTKVCHALHGYL